MYIVCTNVFSNMFSLKYLNCHNCVIMSYKTNLYVLRQDSLHEKIRKCYMYPIFYVEIIYHQVDQMHK